MLHRHGVHDWPSADAKAGRCSAAGALVHTGAAATEALVRRFGGSVLEDTRGEHKVWIADPDGQRIELLTPQAGYHRRIRPGAAR